MQLSTLFNISMVICIMASIFRSLRSLLLYHRYAHLCSRLAVFEWVNQDSTTKCGRRNFYLTFLDMYGPYLYRSAWCRERVVLFMNFSAFTTTRPAIVLLLIITCVCIPDLKACGLIGKWLLCEKLPQSRLRYGAYAAYGEVERVPIASAACCFCCLS